MPRQQIEDTTLAPSERELRVAFRASGLWRRGWIYAKALQDSGVRLLPCTGPCNPATARRQSAATNPLCNSACCSSSP